MKEHKNYSAEFKLEIARMVADQGLTIMQVVKKMKAGSTAVRRWVTQYCAEQLGQRGTGKPITPEQQRMSGKRRPV